MAEDGLDGGQRHALRVQVRRRRPSQQVSVDAFDAGAASDVLDGMVDVRLRERELVGVQAGVGVIVAIRRDADR